MPVWKWSTTASSNDTADSTINWAENQAPSTINNSARAMMAAIAADEIDKSGSITTGGTSTAYTVSTTSVLTSLQDKFRVGFTMHTACGTPVTLAVDGLAAKPLRPAHSVEFGAGDLQSGGVYFAVYNASNAEWIVQDYPQLNPFTAFNSGFVGMVLDYAGASIPPKWLLCYGQAVSRTTYSALFTAITTTYGAGDGSTTFNLPDCRGRTIYGKDNMGGSAAGVMSGANGYDGTILGQPGGSQTWNLSIGQLPTFTPTTSSVTSTVTNGSNVVNTPTAGQASGGSGTNVLHNWSSAPVTVTTTVTINPIGSGTAITNVAPGIIMNKIIYAGV